MVRKSSKISGVSVNKEVIPFDAPMLPIRISSDTYACGYKFNIPTIGWDEPMFVIYGGKLHQALIKRISFDLINRCSNYTLDIAGVGEVDTHCCSWNLRNFSMFAKISDFAVNKEYPKSSDHEIAIKDVFSEVSYCGKYFEIKGVNGTDGLHEFAAFRLAQYMWDEHTLSVKEFRAKISPIIVYDNKRGFHFDNYAIDKGLYSTAEECIMDNTISIVLFNPNELRDKKPLFKGGEWHREDEQNLNACMGYISDEYLRMWLKNVIHAKYDKPADKI